MTGPQGLVLHIAQAIKMGDCELSLSIGEGVEETGTLYSSTIWLSTRCVLFHVNDPPKARNSDGPAKA